MTKTEYAKGNFDNIQELIRFADQKVAAILVVYGIEITIFVDFAKNLRFVTNNITTNQAILFILSFSFIANIFMSLYIGFVRILKPGFAKSYNNNQYSTFYFDHIATNDKNKFVDSIKKISDEKMLKDISEQIYEVSKILRRKNRYCVYLVYLLLLSFIILGLFCLLYINFT